MSEKQKKQEPLEKQGNFQIKMHIISIYYSNKLLHHR